MSEFIEFKAPEIGLNRAKKILPTNKVMRRVWAMQLAQAKLTKASEDSDVDPLTLDGAAEISEQSLKFMDDVEDFLATTLGLTKKQRESIDDLTQEQTGELIARLQVALLYGDANVPDTDEEDEPNPKLESAKE